MATKFQEVKIASIDQGKFLDDGEAAFIKVQKKVIAAAKERGEAIGEVMLKVKIAATKDGAFKLITDVVEKMPKKPPHVTTALVDIGDNDVECLFSQAGGTTPGEARQMRICNDDGSDIKQSVASN